MTPPVVPSYPLESGVSKIGTTLIFPANTGACSTRTGKKPGTFAYTSATEYGNAGLYSFKEIAGSGASTVTDCVAPEASVRSR